MNKQILRGFVLGGVLLGLLVGVAVASTPVIDTIELTPVEEGVEVRIRFNFPLRYLTHTPARRGRVLQVEMRSLFAGSALVEFAGRKVYGWQASYERPLQSLTYEGDTPAGPQLLLEFEHEVEYRIKAGSDPLQFTVLVLTPVEESASSLVSSPKPVATVVTKGGNPVVIAPSIDISRPYAINLESELKPTQGGLPTDRPDLRKYILYRTRFRQGDKNWYRLRLGFFADKRTAQKVMHSLEKEFPDAWLTRTSLTERRNTLNSLAAEPVEAVVKSLPSTDTSLPPLLPLPAERRQRLLDQAEASMVAGDYRRAALFYTGLLQAEDAATRQLAQEYLGLARDKANQWAHAKAEYERYLQLYPEGEGAARVQQRLTVLLTARSLPRQSLRKAKMQSTAAVWKNEAYGSFSQFYYQDSLKTDGREAFLAQSTLRSDIDFNTRSRSEKFDVRTTFIGGLENDFRAGGEDDLRISSVYIDLAALDPEVSLRFGRQSRSTGGVLGRFDGGLLSWQISPKLAANFVGGFPVFSTSDTSVDTERPLYGLSFDIGTFADSWDINLFLINQQVDSMTDRRAVGGELRYFDQTRSFFTLVDYDIFYDKLNTALFNGNLRFANQSILTLSADYRNSPVLTTSNALQGQTVDTIAALRQIFSNDEITQLAEDRTATSQTLNVGLTHPLSEKLQISGDFTLSRFGSTPASGGVAALSGGGNNYDYSLQLIGSSLIKLGDIAIIGLRYSDSASSDIWSFNLNTRYPVTRDLRLNPKMLIDYRNNTTSSGHRFRIRPALRVEYRWKKRFHLDLEGGAEWANETTAGQDSRSRDYFMTLGYRVDF